MVHWQNKKILILSLLCWKCLLHQGRSSIWQYNLLLCQNLLKEESLFLLHNCSTWCLLKRPEYLLPNDKYLLYNLENLYVHFLLPIPLYTAVKHLFLKLAKYRVNWTNKQAMTDICSSIILIMTSKTALQYKMSLKTNSKPLHNLALSHDNINLLSLYIQNWCNCDSLNQY